MTRSPAFHPVTALPVSTMSPAKSTPMMQGIGHLDAGHAPAREDVVVVERGGAHLEDDVVGPRARIGEVRLDPDGAGTAVLVDDRCSHAFASI